jgi:hypothetical protein
MAISAVRRAAAYAAKLDSAVVKTRIDARKTDMISEAGAAQADQASIEAKTRAVIGGATVAVQTILVPAYLAFSRKLGALVRKHSGKTATAEAQLQGDLWVARGLDTAVIDAIALDVHGLTIDTSP